MATPTKFTLIVVHPHREVDVTEAQHKDDALTFARRQFELGNRVLVLQNLAVVHDTHHPPAVFGETPERDEPPVFEFECQIEMRLHADDQAHPTYSAYVQPHTTVLSASWSCPTMYGAIGQAANQMLRHREQLENGGACQCPDGPRPQSSLNQSQPNGQ